MSSVVAYLPLLPARWRASSRWTPAGTKRVLVTGAAAALVTLLNPYFAEGVLSPLKLLGFMNDPVFKIIGELTTPFSGYFPTVAVGAYQLFFFFSVAVVVLAGLLTALSTEPGDHSQHHASRRPAEVAAGMVSDRGNRRDGRFSVADVAIF